ncbi:acetate kinase [Anaerofilum sp. BX8]|uniref:Acetate kinase n=1 Tax=Anaerofilum hominis TaxID=2763016 RepID=A0A923I6L6_9FIRM|nr:acetate kinase [Anaerofilum hominis]MBC5581236.1 acetate kinase [Anaerofilum hominis]
MKILVINCGSSSLKYQLIDMDGEKVLCKGNCERIGIPGGMITHKTADGYEIKVDCSFQNHTEAFTKLISMMTAGDGAVIENIAEIDAIGHRVAQGADKFPHSCLLTEQVIQQISDLSELAPLHNPAHIQGIRAAQKVFGADLPQACVFDTSFHHSMPPKAYMFAIPYEYYKKYNIRRYGFHGTSHRYVSKTCAKLMGKPIDQLRIITCHLGNGSSITAVDHGRSIDTTMGMSPTGGLMMGTRSGDLDPSVVTYIAEKTGEHGNEFLRVFNERSGLLGVSGISSDNRDIERAASLGNEQAQLAHDMLCYQIKKYIGGYIAAMGGLDALVFTGGIGENSDEVRGDVCANMEYLGIKIDEEKNKTKGDIVDLTAEGAAVKTFIICTNEELMIARDTKALVEVDAMMHTKKVAEPEA